MSNGFETCDKPLHCIHGFKTDCPYCRTDELEQQLADEKKAAGYWMEQSCKDHNRAEKAEQQISRYQGGIEVEGVISEFGDILLLEPTPIDIGKRVRVHVIEVE